MRETSGESWWRMREFILDNSGMSSSCFTLQAHPFFSTNFVKMKSGGRPIVSGSNVLSGIRESTAGIFFESQ
jgi:hypothetical protein